MCEKSIIMVPHRSKGEDLRNNSSSKRCRRCFWRKRRSVSILRKDCHGLQMSPRYVLLQLIGKLLPMNALILYHDSSLLGKSTVSNFYCTDCLNFFITVKGFSLFTFQ